MLLKTQCVLSKKPLCAGSPSSHSSGKAESHPLSPAATWYRRVNDQWLFALPVRDLAGQSIFYISLGPDILSCSLSRGQVVLGTLLTK